MSLCVIARLFTLTTVYTQAFKYYQISSSSDLFAVGAHIPLHDLEAGSEEPFEGVDVEFHEKDVALGHGRRLARLTRHQRPFAEVIPRRQRRHFPLALGGRVGVGKWLGSVGIDRGG